jgi:prevent-host-death family protein
MTQPVHEWQATKARDALAEIIDAAARGQPQLIRRRDGKEVVVVSREYFEANKPSLKSCLLSAGFAEDHDEFDDALERVRQNGISPFIPRGAPTDE